MASEGVHITSISGCQFPKKACAVYLRMHSLDLHEWKPVIVITITSFFAVCKLRVGKECGLDM